MVEKSAWLGIEEHRRIAQSLPDLVQAISDFAREDSLNQGFSRQVERRTARLNHQARDAKHRLTEELLSLETEANWVLKPAQRELVADGPKARKKGKVRRRRGKDAVDQLALAKQERTALRREIHPQLGRLGTHLFNPTAAEVLCRIARVSPSPPLRTALELYKRGTEEYPVELRDEHQSELARLRGEIVNWNLINGLHLDADQIDKVVNLYERARPGLTSWEGEARGAAKARNAFLVALEQDVEEVLNAGQRRVLAIYKPCLIPPKNLKDPVRVGQAKSSSRQERWLAGALKLNTKELRQAIDRLIAEDEKNLGRLGSAKRERRKTLIRRTVRRAAAMSDVEFELNKTELAEAIAPHDRAQELKELITALSRERNLSGTIALLMLRPGFIAQLKQRGQQLTEKVKPGEGNLVRGPQAENCRKGCAIKSKGKTGKKRGVKK